LVECGAQATGGIFTDWHKVDGWENMGFPVVECDAEGNFVVSKPENTGGLVSWATVAEQVVYEIGDPANYLLPDVTCDFSNITLTELKDGDGSGVLVTGARGKPPPCDYKVSATYADGYRAVAVCPVIGPRAAEKAQKTAEAIIKRTRAMFKHLGLPDYSQTHIHTIGSETSYGPTHSSLSPREVALWIGVQHPKKEALQIFAREIAPAGTGMAPGLTTLIGGRPNVTSTETVLLSVSQRATAYHCPFEWRTNKNTHVHPYRSFQPILTHPLPRGWGQRDKEWWPWLPIGAASFPEEW